MSNKNIKEHLKARIINFTQDDDFSMDDKSVENALAAIEATPYTYFENWTVFPSPNGTILFSPKTDVVAGISIGSTEMSYAASAGEIQFQGKEPFSPTEFRKRIYTIDLNFFN